MASALNAHASTIEQRIKDSSTVSAFFKKHHQRGMDVAVDWEGMDFDPPDGPWLQVRVLWGEGSMETMGETNSNMVVGVLNLNLFDRPGNGAGDLGELVDILRDLFNRKKLSNDQIRFDAVSGPRPPTTIKEAREGWLQQTLAAPFEVRETV